MRAEVTASAVVAELAAIAFANEEKNGQEKEKTTDRLRALELLGKHLGLFEKGQDTEGKEDWREMLKVLRENGGDIKNKYLKIDLDTN